MYKVWTESDIRNVLNEIGSKMDMSCENILVIISSRMTRSMGMFTFKTKKINGINTIVPVNFKFAKVLLDGRYSEKVVEETILHEYVHCYVNCKYNKNHGHNAFFKRTCRKIGISDNTYFEAETLESVACKERVTPQYQIKCSCCGKVVATRKRKDAVSNLLSDRYRSRCCNSKLTI